MTCRTTDLLNPCIYVCIYSSYAYEFHAFTWTTDNWISADKEASLTFPLTEPLITGVRDDSPKKLALSGFVILWSGFFKKEYFKTDKFILNKRVILRSRFFIVSQCHVGGRSLFWHHHRHHSLLPAEAICIYFHVARFLLERLACTCAYMCAGVFSVVCFSVLRLCCWLWSIFD